MDARRLRPRAAEPGALISLRLGAQRAWVGPLFEVGGEVRTVPDPHARVVVRGSGWLDATWTDGVCARLRVRRARDGYRLDCSVSSTRAVVVGAVGVRVLGLAATRVLVDGYHSWDWAGLRDATQAGRAWWGGVWGDPGGAQTAVAPHEPPRLGPLLLRWNAGRSLGAMSVGAPDQLQHATAEPRLLGIALAAGATLHGDPIRIAPVDARSPWGVGLPRLRPSDRRPAPRTAGWMSWNCLGPAVGAGDVIDAARTVVPPGGLALLDDGWMARWGDWVEHPGLGASLGDLAEAVHAAGRRLGLWLAPFLVDKESHTADTHPHLLLRDASSAPVVTARPPRPQLVLDASLPATRAWLSALGRRIGSLGIDALKLDFVYAGALPGARGGARTDIAALRAGVAAVVRGYRATAPRGARVLACGAPAAPLVGLVDACRSGDDSVVNVPPVGAPPPPRPWFAHGDLLLRAQARNLAARSWLWGATMPPDIDAVSLAAVGDMPPPDDRHAQRWLDLALRSGGPLLDADVPDGRVTPERLRMLQLAQSAATGRPARPARLHDPLSGSATSDDEVGFHDWPAELPDGWGD